MGLKNFVVETNTGGRRARPEGARRGTGPEAEIPSGAGGEAGRRPAVTSLGPCGGGLWGERRRFWHERRARRAAGPRSAPARPPSPPGSPPHPAPLLNLPLARPAPILRCPGGTTAEGGRAAWGRPGRAPAASPRCPPAPHRPSRKRCPQTPSSPLRCAL